MKRGYESFIEIFIGLYIILFIIIDVFLITAINVIPIYQIIEINAIFLIFILLLLALKSALARIRKLEDILLSKNIIQKEELEDNLEINKDIKNINIERLDEKCSDCNINLYKNQYGEIFCPKCNKRYKQSDK